MSEAVDDTYEVDIIGKIREDLQDRYQDHYAILKELIQNADDAGASELHLVFIERLAGTEHELLQGPLLAVINNAAFTFENAAAIRQLQGGSKGLDDCKIGKFGLGQKSVFHLCEAFFFVSDLAGDEEQIPDNAKRYPRSGIRSPWGRNRYASRLKLTDSDCNRLRAAATPFLPPDTPFWFALFLPLRLKQHCKVNPGDDPDDFAIKEEYHDDIADVPPAKMFAKNVVRDLLRVLPFMSTLNVVAHWKVDSTDEKVLHSRVWRDVDQHVDWRTMTVGRRIHTGQIHVTFSDSEQVQSLRYAGCQELLDEQILRDVSIEEGWPRFDMQTVTGRRRGKAATKQHVGVVVLEHQGAGQFLGLVDTVFLPLGAATHQPKIVAGKMDLEVLLHGFFFLDSGRKAIDRRQPNRPTDEETTRQKWNRLLTEKGVLPLLIPALQIYADAVREAGAAKGRDKEGAYLQIRELTRQLQEHDLVKASRPHICYEYSWNLRLTAAGFQWSKVDKNLPLVELPSFGNEDQLPTQVFPELLSLCVSNNITCSKLPHLSPMATQVSDGFVECLLSNVDVSDVKQQEAKIQYLADAVAKWKKHFVGNVLRALIRVLRKLLKDLWSPSETQVPALTQLIQVIPDNYLLPISVPKSETAKALLASMLDCEIDAILVPVCLVNRGDRTLATLSTDHTKTLLGALVGFRDNSSTTPEDFATVTQRIINDVLSAWKPGPSETYTRLDEYKLFHGRHGTVVAWYNATEMKVRNDGGRLFQGNESLLKSLTKCLAISEADKLLLLSRDAKDFLCKWIGAIPGCNVDGFVKLLKNKPLLSSDLEARFDCIHAITAASELSKDAYAGSVLRYLLHGHPAAYESGTSLLVDAGDAWSAMAMAILSARKEAWRLIPRKLVNFKPTDRTWLKIQDCTADNVSQLLNGLSATQSVDCRGIVDRKDWYKTVLEGWPDNCTEQLKRLTAFPRSKSVELVAITSNTFIEGDVSAAFDSVFPQRVFVRDETGILRKRGLVPTVEPKDLIATVLKQGKPSTHWKPIMDSLLKITRMEHDGTAG
jgi:hypothetical protein